MIRREDLVTDPYADLIAARVMSGGSVRVAGLGTVSIVAGVPRVTLTGAVARPLLHCREIQCAGESPLASVVVDVRHLARAFDREVEIRTSDYAGRDDRDSRRGAYLTTVRP